MFECETLCALSLRLPVMSLLAMAKGSFWGRRKLTDTGASVKGSTDGWGGRGQPPQLGHQGPAPGPDLPERRGRAQGGLVQVQATRQLDLDHVHPIGGAAVVLRGEAPGVGLVVANGPAAG